MPNKSRLIIFIVSLPLFTACSHSGFPEKGFGSTNIGIDVCSNQYTKSSISQPELLRIIPLEQEGGGTLYLSESVMDNETPWSSAAPTKGSIITTERLGGFTGYETFGMDAFILNQKSDLNQNDWIKEHSSDYPVYFKGGYASKNADDEWLLDDGTGSDKYPWLIHTDFGFWSYAPKEMFLSDGTSIFSREGCSINGYSIPTDVPSQKDIIVAYSAMNSGDGGNKVDIHFQHALATVMFKLNMAEKCHLKKVTISGAYATGNLTVTNDGTAPVFTWGNLKDADTVFGQNFDESTDFKSSGDKKGYQDEEGSKVFFMIPQKKKVTITIDGSMDTGGSFTQTITDLDVNWLAGKYYVYQISTDGALTLDVVETVDNPLTVKSNVSIQNTGVFTTYVRAAVTGSWVDDAGNYVAGWDYDPENPDLSGFSGLVAAGSTSGTWYYHEGFYYFTKAISSTIKTDDLFTSFTRPTTAPLPGAHLEMVIHAQGVQYFEGGPSRANAAWGLPDGILTSTVKSL